MYDKYSLKKRKKTSDAISARQKISKEGKLETQESIFNNKSGKHVDKSKYTQSLWNTVYVKQ